MESTDEDLEDFFNTAEEDVPKVLETEKELQEHLNRLADLRERKDALKAELKDIEVDLLQEQRVIEVTFGARGIGKISLEGVGLFYTSTKFYAGQHNKAALIEFFDRIGEGALAQRTVHPARLTKWWQETMERGGELPPPEVASAFEKSEIRFRREKVKK